MFSFGKSDDVAKGIRQEQSISVTFLVLAWQLWVLDSMQPVWRNRFDAIAKVKWNAGADGVDEMLDRITGVATGGRCHFVDRLVVDERVLAGQDDTEDCNACGAVGVPERADLD